MRVPSLVCAAFLLAASGLCGELRLSGAIGQSQPNGAEPLPSIGMKGAEFDGDGGLWSFSEDGMLRRFISKDGTWILDRSIKAPSPLGIGALRKIGGSIVYAGANGSIYSFAAASSSFSKLGTLPKGAIAFQALEDGMKFKYIALADGKAMAAKPGKSIEWQELFPPPQPKKARVYSIGVEPSEGEIIAGASYPEMKVRRYGWNGEEHVSSSWPKNNVHSELIATAGGIVWAISNEAIALSAPREMRIGGEWTSKANGLARADDGSWWLSTTQGIIGYDAKLKPLGVRLGGMAGPSLLATSPDGTLIAYDSGRMLRFMADDGPASPPKCRFQETFRAGGNWKSNAIAMQFDGLKFIVLDNNAKRLWAFDPWRTGYRESSWLPLTEENAFVKPVAMALGDGITFVVDRGELLYRKNASEGPFAKTGLNAKGPIAANSLNELFIVEGGRISACSISPDGASKELWSVETGASCIESIAAGETFLAAIEPLTGKVSIFSSKDGSPMASLSSVDVQGGMEPISVCVMEPWVFIGDKSGKRILRLRFKGTS